MASVEHGVVACQKLLGFNRMGPSSNQAAEGCQTIYEVNNRPLFRRNSLFSQFHYL